MVLMLGEFWGRRGIRILGWFFGGGVFLLEFWSKKMGIYG